MDHSFGALFQKQRNSYQKVFNNSLCIPQYGGSTVLASTANKLIIKDLHSVVTNPSSNLPICHELSLSQISSEFAVVLPRQGQSYSTCGTVKAVHKTIEDNCIDIFHHHCNRPECPCQYCQDHMLSFEAHKDADRLIEMSNLYHKLGIDLGWPYHLILSPPQEPAKKLCETPDGYKKLRSEGIAFAKSIGVKGGVLMVHAYRIKGEIETSDDLLPDYEPNSRADMLHKAGYGIGKCGKGSLWDGVFADALNLGSAYEYLYLSPHFHIHGYGFLDNARVVYDKTGWIYKKGDKLKKYEALSGSIRYALSHCTRLEVYGVVVSKSDSWFGDMAYNKGGANEVFGAFIPKLCEHGFQYYEAALDGSNELFDEIWIRPVIRTYRLSTKTKPPPPIMNNNFSEFMDISEIHELGSYANIG